jgi:hypothetical protein
LSDVDAKILTGKSELLQSFFGERKLWRFWNRDSHFMAFEASGERIYGGGFANYLPSKK